MSSDPLPPLKDIRVLELAGLAPGKPQLTMQIHSFCRPPPSRLWRLRPAHRPPTSTGTFQSPGHPSP
ncbi:isopenicillin N-CoA epimerase [Histoplasma ohiense]|nr:isopenicillin N-CoA epimerase [Histoplasma ohiense (nom. inval.)]